MRALLSLFAASACLASTASAQGGDSQDGPLFGAWKIQCAAENNCQAYVNLVSAETNQLALTASFHIVAGAERPTAVATIPLGVALRAGVRLRAPSLQEPIMLEPEVCYPDGCRVVFTPTPAQLAAITRDPSYTINFFSYGVVDKHHSVSVPTDGLAKALEHLRQQAARQ